ncbi:MAG: VWA domain-containing protein [Chthoniobacteraceae bacterium]
MNLEHWITWGAPQWLWALALLPLAVGLFAWSERRRTAMLSKLVAARLQTELAGSVSLFKRRLHFALTLAALACFIAALALPRHGFTLEEAKRKGRDVLLAVDTSRSMLSTDVKPNRLERAKLAAQDLISSLQGDRVGLLAFAGSSFLQAPLTVDYTAVLDSLKELDTNIIPLGGTDIAEAIRAAVKTFGKGESESRVLVIFTDGEDLSADAIAEAKRAGSSVHIFTVGVGSAGGSLIPVPNENGGTEFVKGPDGQFVKSHLDEKTLTAIAESANGFYTHLQNSPAEMQRLVDAGLGKLKEGDIDSRLAKRPIERYQWPLGFGIVLLIGSVLINERRRNAPRLRVGPGAVAACLAALAFTSSPARADEGVELYLKGKFAEAQAHFEKIAKRRPGLPDLEYDKGTTQYAQGNLEAASVAFGKALATDDPKLRAKAEHNLGTTLLKRALGRDEVKQETERKTDLKNSIQHLEEALKADANNPDTRKNLDLARRELAKPKPTPTPQQQKQDDQKKDDKQDQKDQQDQQQAKDPQSKDQKSKDQQSKDQQSKDQQSKDQQSKDQQSKDQQPKDQQSKDQQSKDQQSKDQQSKDQQSKDQQGQDQKTETPQPSQQPQGASSPTPGQDEQKKLSGDIKANDSSKHEEEQQAAEEAQAKPGEMTPAQARAVLDSLKGEDEQPFKIQPRSNAPVLKDW